MPGRRPVPGAGARGARAPGPGLSADLVAAPPARWIAATLRVMPGAAARQVSRSQASPFPGDQRPWAVLGRAGSRRRVRW
jgi:hypothetical protein